VLDRHETRCNTFCTLPQPAITAEAGPHDAALGLSPPHCLTCVKRLGEPQEVQTGNFIADACARARKLQFVSCLMQAHPAIMAIGLSQPG
jgi:hypothetical protein